MEAVFRSFCSSGADKGATPLMEGTKLVKLCRDLKLLDKNLTSSDVDIIFSKVKSKAERKINFKQFEDSLKMIADKKFPGAEDALDKLKAKILEGGGPIAHGVMKAAKAGVVDRLTEASSKASPSGMTAALKAANSDISGRAKAAVGGIGKSLSSQIAGKSNQSAGKAGGGKSTENDKDVQKQNQTPAPDGKDIDAALGMMENEDTKGKESPPGKGDVQANAETAEKCSQKGDERLTVSENQETQAKQE